MTDFHTRKNNLENNLRKFIEKKPLYVWKEIDLPEYPSQFCSLSKIEMTCPTCKKSRPFTDRRLRGTGGGLQESKLQSDMYSFKFICDGCNKDSYIFFIEVDVDKKCIRKVGQNPAWSINIEKSLENFLEDDTPFFKKALICESQGYGIAAFAYYRRVLENSINKILTELQFVLESQNAPSEDIKRIDEALKNTIMDERIRIAKDSIPNYLRPNGMNPLSIIYNTLSAGIHRLAEEECLENAQSIRTALCYLINTLAHQTKEQRDFFNSMKNLNDFNSKVT